MNKIVLMALCSLIYVGCKTNIAENNPDSEFKCSTQNALFYHGYKGKVKNVRHFSGMAKKVGSSFLPDSSQFYNVFEYNFDESGNYINLFTSSKNDAPSFQLSVLSYSLPTSSQEMEGADCKEVIFWPSDSVRVSTKFYKNFGAEWIHRVYDTLDKDCLVLRSMTLIGRTADCDTTYESAENVTATFKERRKKWMAQAFFFEDGELLMHDTDKHGNIVKAISKKDGHLNIDIVEFEYYK
jgi:hypothetical protein